jgi:hypothetical protein
MQCSLDVACLIGELWQWVASETGRQFIWQFLKDLAAILGVVLTFLKWWESREAYVFGRLSSVLGEQATRTRDALRYVIQRMRRPGPAEPPRFPVFVEGSLRRLFSQRHWKPVLSLASPFTSADRKLRRIHRRLDKRQRAATDYLTFVHEQRFAAHVLQGAIALGRSELIANDSRLSRLNEAAADFFERALRIAGKENDLDALELKGLILRKLGQVDANGLAGAPQTFQQLQAAATAQLAALDRGAIDKRRELTFVIVRAARYQAEMLHSATPATGAALALLTGVEQMLGEPVSGQALLDRARYYEVNSCIRVALLIAAGQPIGAAASMRINAALRDYQTLRDDCDPKNWDWPTRIWRTCARVFREDGAKQLLREAKAGLSRMERIQQRQGCPICTPTLAAGQGSTPIFPTNSMQPEPPLQTNSKRPLPPTR